MSSSLLIQENVIELYSIVYKEAYISHSNGKIIHLKAVLIGNA